MAQGKVNSGLGGRFEERTVGCLTDKRWSAHKMGTIKELNSAGWVCQQIRTWFLHHGSKWARSKLGKEQLQELVPYSVLSATPSFLQVFCVGNGSDSAFIMSMRIQESVDSGS